MQVCIYTQCIGGVTCQYICFLFVFVSFVQFFYFISLFVCVCASFFFTQLDSLACCARMYGMLSCVFAVTVVF